MKQHDPLKGTIFNQDKTDLSIKQQQRELERELRREVNPERQSGMVILGVLVGLVVLVLVIGVIVMALNPQDMKAQDEDKGEFVDTAAIAEISADGIKGAVTRVYYTLDGSLAVYLDLGNGMDTAQQPLSIYLKLQNENGQVIGAGRADAVPEDFYIPSGERRDFLLYIAPEHVQIHSDDLDQIAYELTIQSEDFV